MKLKRKKSFPQNVKVSRVDDRLSKYANSIAIDMKCRLMMVAVGALSDLVSRLKVLEVSIGCDIMMRKLLEK